MDDDYTMGELFAGRKAASQAKRAGNREFSTNLLRDRGVEFTSHNDGAHLVVLGKWNFWPGTGKFAERRGTASRRPREGRGVHRLLTLIEEDTVASERKEN